MSQKPQSTGSTDTSQSQKTLQALKVAVSPVGNPFQSNTAPTTPTKSSRTALLFSSNAHSANATSQGHSLVAKPATDHHDANKIDLCPWQIPTDPEDMEDEDAHSESSREAQSETKKKSSRSFTNYLNDIKKPKGRRSQSVRNEPKSPVEKESNSLVKWPNRNPSITPSVSEKSAYHSKERSSRGSIGPNRVTMGREELPKTEKKASKTPIKDIDLEFKMENKCVTEGEGPESLFEDASSSKDLKDLKDLHLREIVGPIRYSKMSEEEAATLFEMRKRELLSFLIKLGANPALVKKKLGSRNTGILQQSPERMSDLPTSDLDRERVMRTLRGTLEDRISSNRFIVYNTERDSWNPPVRGRFATPTKERRKKALSKVGRKSAPDTKRRNSAKVVSREKDDLNVMIKRNLTASFNQIVVDGKEMLEIKSPIKVKKVMDIATPATTVRPEEEKKENVENFTIDLTKIYQEEKKKKKTRKNKKKNEQVKAEEDKTPPSESGTTKKSSEDTTASTVAVAESNNKEVTKDNATCWKIIETMRQKSKVVRNEIEEIDLQIQRMKDDGKKMPQKRGREEILIIPKKEELPNKIFLENIEESYAYAARLKKDFNRPRSLSIKAPEPMDQSTKSPKVNIVKLSTAAVPDQNRRQSIKDDKGGKQLKEAINGSTKGNNTFEIKQNRSNPVASKNGQSENEKRDNKVVDLNNKRGGKNDQNVVKPLSPEYGVSSPVGLKSKSNITNDLKAKTPKMEKGIPDLYQSPNSVQTFSSANKQQQQGKDRLVNAFDTKDLNRVQVARPENGKMMKKANESISNSTRDTAPASFKSTKEEAPTNDKKVLSTPNVGHQKTNLRMAVSPEAQKLVAPTKKSTKKALDKSQQSIEKDILSEASDSRIEKQRSNPKPTKTGPKISFSEGVKKILSEASSNVKPKTSVKASQSSAPKKVDSNRPSFPLASTADIRGKIYREGRLTQGSGTFLKVNIQGNSAIEGNKRDLKDIVLEMPISKKLVVPELTHSRTNSRERSSVSPSLSQDSNMMLFSGNKEAASKGKAV